MSVIIKDSIKNVLAKDRNNDYAIFEDVKSKYGVYIFQKPDGKILYIGEARDQTLKDRITQNFTEKDTGGTFRKNFLEKSQNDFKSFLTEISECKVIFITTENRSMLIRALESILILILQPVYNKDA